MVYDNQIKITKHAYKALQLFCDEGSADQTPHQKNQKKNQVIKYLIN